MARFLVGAAIGLLTLFGSSIGVEAQSPCAPGQPPGRPPGQPPGQPGQPEGRPPQYPPGQCQLRLSRSAAAPGQSVTAAGSGFAPGSSVQLALGAQSLGSATTDGTGAFTTDVAIPAGTPPGSRTMTAAGRDVDGGAHVLSASFTVVGSSAPAGTQANEGASLPRTGSSSPLPLAVAGMALVGVGTAATMGARRRRGI